MKILTDWLKNFRLIKILTVILAAFCLLTVQACNSPGIAAQPPQPANQSPNAVRYDPTKSYPLNTPQGGMNNFSDVDPRARAEEKAAEAKAKALRDAAKRNIDEKGIDSTEQYVRNYRQGTPFPERVKNLGEDVGGSTEELRQGVVKGTQRGLENIKENTQNAAEDLGKNVQRGAADIGRNIQQQAEDTTDAINRTIREAK